MQSHMIREMWESEGNAFIFVKMQSKWYKWEMAKLFLVLCAGSRSSRKLSAPGEVALGDRPQHCPGKAHTGSQAGAGTGSLPLSSTETRRGKSLREKSTNLRPDLKIWFKWEQFPSSEKKRQKKCPFCNSTLFAWEMSFFFPEKQVYVVAV